MATRTKAKRKSTAATKRRGRTKKKSIGYEVAASIALFAAGLLLLAMLFVPGTAFWLAARTWLFGVFGLNLYWLGALLIYLAVLVAQGRPVLLTAVRALLGAVCLSGVAAVFSGLEIAGLTAAEVADLFMESGSTKLLGCGLFGMPAGAVLLALCGRPAANIIVVVLCLCAVMVITGVTPAELWEFFALNADSARRKSGEALDDYRARREQRQEELEARREQRQGQLEAMRTRQDEEEDEDEDEEDAGSELLKRHRWFNFFHREEVDAPAAPQEAPKPGEAPSESAPAAKPEPQPAKAAAPAAKAEAPKPKPEPPAGPRASFDIDLGPDPVAVTKGVSEPIEPIPVGPGGTFGLEGLRRTHAAGKPGSPSAQTAAATSAAPAIKTPPAEPKVILPEDPAVILPEPAAQTSAPATVQTTAAPAQPAPAPTPSVDPFGDDEGWIAIGDAPIPSASIETLAAAAMDKPQQAERAATAAPAEEKPVVRAYQYPPLDLFDPAPETADAGAEAELKANAQKLVDTLESFGVKTRVLDISRGPSVTRYELQPLAGVKISRITSLADDIALNLAVGGVRMEAPIPGKPAVGVEVPNRKSSAVKIRGIFESQNFQRMASPLAIALGKDIAGVAQVGDLCKMPHLLIAGSTGSGKSVCVNSIIISFLYRNSPEDVRLILIDPKVVELAEYNGIPHLLMPVVTEPRKAAGALGSAVAEMERRYHLFADNNVRDIKTFNRLAQENDALEKLPYIAIVIDELADLMMVAGKEVEDYICRIAQKARAAGMHLIVATQRPSVDVITGLIKANIPSRVAFAVSSQVDSRTILDGAGAEKLLGMGDMLFMPVGASKPTRVQGTYVSDEEISRVLDFIKAGGGACYDEAMIREAEKIASQEKGGGSSGGDDGDDDGEAWDPMLNQCAECVIDAGQASTSLLQRRCKLGYARAARIMDQLEQRGIIGPYEGAKPRAVLISRQQWLEMQVSGAED